MSSGVRRDAMVDIITLFGVDWTFDESAGSR